MNPFQGGSFFFRSDKLREQLVGILIRVSFFFKHPLEGLTGRKIQVG